MFGITTDQIFDFWLVFQVIGFGLSVIIIISLSVWYWCVKISSRERIRRINEFIDREKKKKPREEDGEFVLRIIETKKVLGLIVLVIILTYKGIIGDFHNE